jgi:peroxiredoxin
MRKVITIISFVFASQVSFAQQTFSECFDTLYYQRNYHWAHDSIASTEPNETWSDCIKGKEMPYLSLKSISGEKIETKGLKGKVLVINLWFTTCHPCIAELPALNKLVKEYKDKNVVFLGLSTDTKEMLDRDFFPNYNFDFKIISGAGDIVEKIGHTGFPTTYIVDTKGKVIDAWIGGSTGKDAETAAYLRAKPIIDELLKGE